MACFCHLNVFPWVYSKLLQLKIHLSALSGCLFYSSMKLQPSEPSGSDMKAFTNRQTDGTNSITSITDMVGKKGSSMY